uniref:Uncharacterized protein n=1 Tax=Opuntia streptacantha TaxID=393608 RepID=A0A7C9CLN8_OPUST
MSNNLYSLEPHQLDLRTQMRVGLIAIIILTQRLGRSIDWWLVGTMTLALTIITVQVALVLTVATVEEVALCSILHHSCSRCLVATTASFLLRGDPFSPVTHPQSVLGLSTL